MGCPFLLCCPLIALITSYTNLMPGCELPGDTVYILLEGMARKGGSCLELRWLCAFLHRMSWGTMWNWSPGGWLQALCLAWLWTYLALASLQPPTATGLGQVVGLGPAELTTPHPIHIARWTKLYRLGGSGCFSVYHPGNTAPYAASARRNSGQAHCSASLPLWKEFCRE